LFSCRLDLTGKSNIFDGLNCIRIVASYHFSKPQYSSFHRPRLFSALFADNCHVL
jgi:hypothetical protein